MSTAMLRRHKKVEAESAVSVADSAPALGDDPSKADLVEYLAVTTDRSKTALRKMSKEDLVAMVAEAPEGSGVDDTNEGDESEGESQEDTGESEGETED